MITRNPEAGHPAVLVHIPHLPRPAFRVNSLRSSVGLLVASTILTLTVVILVARAEAVLTANLANPDNPFALYTSIMPGHSLAGLDEHNCQSAFDRNSTPPCSIIPDNGPFHLISITRRNDIITEASFYSETLQLGDLIHQWGDPVSMHRNENGRAITLIWDTGTHLYSATMALRGSQPHVRVVTARLSCDGSNTGVCSQPS
jgi:hypothetical protein